MFFGLFGASKKDVGASSFWAWFTVNEPRLFSCEQGSEEIFDALDAALQKVHRDLTFEFGPERDGKREFVISAGGIKAAFPAVEALCDSAPVLERWIWVKFRPRRHPLHDIEFDGKSVRVEDVGYLLARDEPKVGIVLFFDGYNESEKDVFGQIGYLLLDEALGEYAVEMQVGFIEFQSRESRHFPQAYPLVDLPAHFDEVWAKKAH